MRKVLKWILYILLGLVVVGVVAGVVFALFGMGHGAYGYYMMRPGLRMMQPYGFHVFRPSRLLFGGIFGGLICLGFLVLIVVGIVALVDWIIRRNRPAQATVPAQTTPPAQPAAVEPTVAPEQAATPARNCGHCGKPVQDDWMTCPYCGSPLT